jgi:hypothetical protein
VHRRFLYLAAALSVLAVGSPAGAATQLPGVGSPSGNLRCLLLPGPSRNLLCTIGHAKYATQLQSKCMAPGGAGVDWHGFTLSPTGKGFLNCSGGIQYNPTTQHPSYVTLAYGRARRLGSFTCTSTPTGLTCRNGRGHGLFLSRESWRAW